MTVAERKAAFERDPPAVRERALLRFDGVDGFDVYNCSAPFPFRGRRHVFGRVERRDRWDRAGRAVRAGALRQGKVGL